jgi:hypothetical protein
VTSPSAVRQASVLSVLALLAFITSACGLQADWHSIYSADISPNGRALTLTLVFSPPRKDGSFCEQIKDTSIDRSSKKVVVGVKIYNSCDSLLPWEKNDHTALGYFYRKTITLQTPLSGASIVDRATGNVILDGSSTG